MHMCTACIEGYEYWDAMIKPLSDILVDSSKHNPIPPVGISNINATNDNTVQNENNKNIKNHLSLRTKQLIGRKIIILSVWLHQS